jgi:hypothetical protein
MTAMNLKVGDRIRVAQIPLAVLRYRKRFPETFELFQRAVGHIYEIRDINEHGHAELWLQDDGAEDSGGGAHSIYIEPEFIHIA